MPEGRCACVALGSNLPVGFQTREAALQSAVERVGRLGEVLRVSSFVDTAPVGFLEQPRFLNGALLLRTEMDPLELLRALLEIERQMGRQR
jgi:2-amino-4-hydroxy-6-hydroxymethyldihydropteridine diphosphokinase